MLILMGILYIKNTSDNEESSTYSSSEQFNLTFLM